MDSAITAAGRALRAGDPLGALNRVALRDDPAALALRGIAMAQLGDLHKARELLQRAARGSITLDRNSVPGLDEPSRLFMAQVNRAGQRLILVVGLTRQDRAEMQNSQMRSDTHSKLLGYLLWIFGFTGSHRFYYGKPISGTIWLFTLGLLGIGWLIDLFLIPGMDRQAEACAERQPRQR